MIDEKKAQTLKVIKLSLKGLTRQGVFPQSDMDEFQAALDSATDYFSSDGISPDEYQRHMKEELGDVLWYAALACKCGGFSMSDLMRGNIEKLQRRYPDGFSAERSRGRDK